MEDFRGRRKYITEDVERSQLWLRVVEEAEWPARGIVSSWKYKRRKLDSHFQGGSMKCEENE